MKKNINKSTIVAYLLSVLLLITIPSTRAAAQIEQGRESALSQSETKGQSDPLAKINADYFWQLVKQQLGGNPLPNLEDKEIILLLGQTGVGKSTFINRMLGHEFAWEYEEAKPEEAHCFDFLSTEEQRGSKKLVMTKKNPNAPVAGMGNGAKSCTTIPQIYILRPENLALVDCPGFDDSKGTAHEILNFLMIHLFVHKAKRVKAIIGMIPHSAFTDGGRGNHFLYLVKQLDYLVKFEKCLPNIFWGITRYAEGTSRSAIITQIEAIKEAKIENFQASQLLANEGEKKGKDKILLEKLLENENNILPLSPLYTKKMVTGLKKFLAESGNIQQPIDKAHFTFYHPTLDVKGIVRAIFSYPEKLKLVNTYKIHQETLNLEAAAEQKITVNKAILADHHQLSYYVKNAIADKERELAQTKKDWHKASIEADILNKNKEKLICHRTERVRLHARYFSDEKTITYNDFTFEENALEEIYERDKVVMRSKTSDPKHGVYKAEFTITGTFLNWWNNSANDADVTVKFYVKNEHIQRELILQKEEEERQKGNIYREKEKDLALAKKDVAAYLVSQTKEVLPQQIQKLQDKRKQLEKDLAKEYSTIHFIGEVYPCLYPNVDDYFNHFANAYKHTFELFSKNDSNTTYDYTLQNYYDQVSPIHDEAYLDIEEMPAALTSILQTASNSDNHTPQLLAMVAENTQNRQYYKYLFASNGLLSGRLAQKKAHQLNYHLIKSPPSPVLWQALSLLAENPKLRLVQCVLPKESPLCLPCGHIATHLLNQSLLMKKGGCQGQTCPKMTPAAGAVKAFHSPRFSDQQRRLTLTAIGDIFDKNHIRSYNNEYDRAAKHQAIEAPLLSDQLLIPANGQCLYTTIIMGYLLPVRQESAKVTERIDQLFGLQPATYVNQLGETLNNPTHYLTYLHSDSFNALVAAFMTLMKIEKGTWGGPQEIQTIANKLKVNIQEHYPSPGNPTTLVQSDLTKPTEAETDITLHIVRDKVHTAEIAMECAKSSAKDNPHYQHYRLKYTLPPSIPAPLLPSKQPPISDQMGSQKNQPHSVEWFKAAKTGNRKLLEELYGYNALLQSDLYQQLDGLLQQNADINTKDKEGYTALLWSAKNGYLDCVTYLIQQGADINAKNKEGNTALLYSAQNGDLAVVKYLVQQDADVTLKGERQRTALQWAKAKKHQNVVDYLLSFPKKGQPDKAVLEQWFEGAKAGKKQLLETIYKQHNINVDHTSECQATALLWCAYKGHLDCLKYLVKQGADIHAKDENNNTALLWSAQEGHVHCIAYLYQQGADIDAIAQDGYTALLLSAEKGYLDCVKFLLQQGADIDVKNTKNNTAFLLSSKKGHLSCVKWLVKQGANIKWKGQNGKTALEWAIKKDKHDVVNYLSSLPKKQRPNSAVLKKWFDAANTGDRKLLAALYNQYEINIDDNDEDNCNALLSSTCKGHLDCIKYLVEQGADVNAKGKKESAPLLTSAQQGHLDCIKYLLQQGADINIQDKDGGTPLLWSAYKGHLACLKYLVQQGANINAKNKKGDTVLILSAYSGDVACVKYLIQQGIDVNAVAPDGYTALILSAQQGHLDCVQLLGQQEGIDIHLKDNNQYTALLWSAQQGYLDCVKFLRKKGAHIDMRDKWGNTALLRSAQYGHLDCVKYLVSQGADIHTRDNDGESALAWAIKAKNQDVVTCLLNLTNPPPPAMQDDEDEVNYDIIDMEIESELELE